MRRKLRCASVLVFCCSFCFSQTTKQEDTSPQGGTGSSAPSNASASPSTNYLGEARELYRKGDFDGAIEKYQSFLQVRPGSPDAYAGMCRVYLKQRKLGLAASTVNDGLALSHESPRLHVALGEVLFRQGKINEAELEWVKV